MSRRTCSSCRARRIWCRSPAAIRVGCATGPRTEGLFARIEHVADTAGDYWEVARPGRAAHPVRHATSRRRRRRAGATRRRAPIPGPTRARVFGWRITETTGRARQPDPLRLPARDQGDESGAPVGPAADRPDLLRRLRRPRRPVVPGQGGLRVRAAAGPVLRLPGRVRDPHVAALPQRSGSPRMPPTGSPGWPGSTASATSRRPFNGASLLARIDVVGIDDQDGARAGPGDRAPAAADLRLLRLRPGRAPVRGGHRPGLADRRAQRPDPGPGRPARHRTARHR